ncbi:hypothetical protein OF83DRAFT_1180551 [Amylostereum chailletii]|nr:hypothetical protein OF83DRAFT_1180551 [Amylostereum chailletii]
MSSPINLSTLFSLSDRVALVSGAGSGIGSYIAHGLAQAGMTRVYITGRRLEALQATATYAPSIIVPIQGDISTRAGCLAIRTAFEDAEHARGVEGELALDLLVNNAGMICNDARWEADAGAEAVSAKLLEATDEDWARGFATNTASLQWMPAAFLPHLVRASRTAHGLLSDRGTIINNTSVSALYASRASQVHLYAATKAAAESLTRNLASKFTPLGVRVNSLAVASIPSEMNDPRNPEHFISKAKGAVPVGRVGREEDAVAAVVYLASRAGSFVSGATLKIDGGILVGA